MNRRSKFPDAKRILIDMALQAFDRRQWLKNAFLLPLSLRGQERRKGPPNIVWIMLDDLGHADLGCYGQKRIRTPNIDALARQGMRFRNCYAGASVCAPSRSVLMTGLHTGHSSVRANAGTVPLRPEDRTVAQMLKSAGYTCGLFGKWGLGDAGSTGVPSRKGFDESFGYLHQIHAHDYYTDYLWHNDRKAPLTGNEAGRRTQYSADVIAEKSLEFVRRNRRNPFFLYLATTLPHAKYEAPDLEPYADQQWPETEKIYAAMVTRADGHAGALMKLLDELGLTENTIVFLTSDNGAPSARSHDFFASSGKLRGYKGQIYEGGLRVPMLVRWPGRVGAGVTSEAPWSFCDFFPTAASIAGGKQPSGLDGVSMLPVLIGEKKTMSPRLLYWEQYQFDRKANDLRVDTLTQAGRLGDWKAVRSAPAGALELYNLQADPSEQNDVSAQHPEIVAKMDNLLKTAHTDPRPHNTGSFEFVR
ncbi:MAG TPA: arylsulfatase [Bryobacteraceae bacterium]|nr:arylsulfatase [Bryobacteraceae bacterium]